MIKLIVSLILLLLCFGTQHKTDLNVGQLSQDRKYIQSVMDKYTVPYKRRIENCIILASYEDGHPIPILTRLIEKESSFQHWAENYNGSCLGLTMVSVRDWGHLPYRLLNKRYAKLLKKHDGTNISMVLKFIRLNTKAGSVILKEYKGWYDGDYNKALRQYGGWNSRKHKHKKKKARDYVDFIVRDI